MRLKGTQTSCKMPQKLHKPEPEERILNKIKINFDEERGRK